MRVPYACAVLACGLLACTFDYDAFSVAGSSNPGTGASGGGGGTGATSSAGGSGVSGGDGVGAAAGPGGGGQGAGPTSFSCDPGSYVTAVHDTGVTCVPFDDTIAHAVGEGCSFYIGWRDSCDGCTNPPTAWGFASQKGADASCSVLSAAAGPVDLVSLDLEGNVDGNDKLYFGLECAPAPPDHDGPCSDGELVTGVLANGTVRCGTVSDIAVAYASQHCSLYAGWRNFCSSCNDGPEKYGLTGPAGCNVTGNDSTCSNSDLGNVDVALLGLNTDNQVSDNDRFYLSFHCTANEVETTLHPEECPRGEFVVELASNGVLCSPLMQPSQDLIRTRCVAYGGHRGDCDECTDPAANWAGASTTQCDTSQSNASCHDANLFGTNVKLGTFNPNEDVDSDDRLYAGFSCL